MELEIGIKSDQPIENMNDNEPTVSLSLTVKKGNEALQFYQKAFGAVELYRMPTPDGGIAHAEFVIGTTKIFLSDEAEDWHAFAMPEGASASCLFGIMTDSCDESFARAKEAGAEVLSEPADQFWGSRSAIVKDPFGYRWSFSEVIEEVSPEEMMKRANEAYGI